MTDRFDIEERWPELFEQLDERRRRSVVQTLASSWHEGWVPNREDTENLTDKARGAIDHDEYLRRVDEAAERRRQLREARAWPTDSAQLDDDPPTWWHDHRNLAKLAMHLAAAGDDIDDIVYMLEKPWKYTPEFNQVQQSARQSTTPRHLQVVDSTRTEHEPS